MRRKHHRMSCHTYPFGNYNQMEHYCPVTFVTRRKKASRTGHQLRPTPCFWSRYTCHSRSPRVRLKPAKLVCGGQVSSCSPTPIMMGASNVRGKILDIEISQQIVNIVPALVGVAAQIAFESRARPRANAEVVAEIREERNMRGTSFDALV